eukprot:gene161-41860_t
MLGARVLSKNAAEQAARELGEAQLSELSPPALLAVLQSDKVAVEEDAVVTAIAAVLRKGGAGDAEQAALRDAIRLECLSAAGLQKAAECGVSTEKVMRVALSAYERPSLSRKRGREPEDDAPVPDPPDDVPMELLRRLPVRDGHVGRTVMAMLSDGQFVKGTFLGFFDDGTHEGQCMVEACEGEWAGSRDEWG